MVAVEADAMRQSGEQAVREPTACSRWLARNVSKPRNSSWVAALRRVSPHRVRRRVFALITFGYELEMLALHMRVLQPEVTRFLVAEATSTYDAINQGRLAPDKPAVLSEAIGQRTFPPDLAELVTVRVLRAAEEAPRCKAAKPARFAGPHGCWEARHRSVLLELLFGVADRDDDLALLADVDEIASPQVDCPARAACSSRADLARHATTLACTGRAHAAAVRSDAEQAGARRAAQVHAASLQHGVRRALLAARRDVVCAARVQRVVAAQARAARRAAHDGH